MRMLEAGHKPVRHAISYALSFRHADNDEKKARRVPVAMMIIIQILAATSHIVRRDEAARWARFADNFEILMKADYEQIYFTF